MPIRQNPREVQSPPPWQTSLFAMVNQDSCPLGIPSESGPTQVGISLNRHLRPCNYNLIRGMRDYNKPFVLESCRKACGTVRLPTKTFARLDESMPSFPATDDSPC